MIKTPPPKKAALRASSPDDAARYSFCLLGPLSFGVSLGMQLMMTALALWGVSNDKTFGEQLSEYGKIVTHPEHELPIFAAAVLAALVIVLVKVRWWRHKLSRIPARQLAGYMTFSALLQGAFAVISMVMYLALLFSYHFSRDFAYQNGPWKAPGEFPAVTLLLPGVLAVACVALDTKGYLRSIQSPDRPERRWLRVGKVLGYSVPVFIILVVGVPPGTWTYLAGRLYQLDQFHHVNFYMMGPALAFAHGKAFATEIYSQYGIGWPLIFSAFSHFSAMTFGNLLGLEIVYGCIYYIALFFLLRMYFKHDIWAALGVILSVYWQMFCGVDRDGVIWQTPSSTMMRHPMDVWFFLILVTRRHWDKRLWAALAGLVSALGVFFETETGIYLLVSFVFYWILQAGITTNSGRRFEKKGFWVPLGAFVGIAAVTLLLLLSYATRGTLFTRAFLRGWLEALMQYGGWGVGALPMAGLGDAPVMVFMIMVLVYLAVIAYAAIRWLNSIAGKDEVFLATVSGYGLALLLLFVSRSHPYNLCHPAIPFAIVLTTLFFQLSKGLAPWLRQPSFPFVWTGGLILLLLTTPTFLRYPSVLHSFFAGTPHGGLSLISNPTDVSGLPPDSESYVRGFNSLVSAIQTIASDGKDVGILDADDTNLYYAAHVRPWSRYSPLFQMALTRQLVDNIRNDLIERPPKHVMILGVNSARPREWEFIWSPLYQVVKDRFELRGTLGPYEIWQHRD